MVIESDPWLFHSMKLGRMRPVTVSNATIPTQWKRPWSIAPKYSPITFKDHCSQPSIDYNYLWVQQEWYRWYRCVDERKICNQLKWNKTPCVPLKGKHLQSAFFWLCFYCLGWLFKRNKIGTSCKTHPPPYPRDRCTKKCNPEKMKSRKNTDEKKSQPVDWRPVISYIGGSFDWTVIIYCS